MGIVQISAIAMIAVLLISLLKQYRPEYAVTLEIAAGIVLLLLIVASFTDIIDIVENLIDTAGIDKGYFALLLKALGVSVIGQLAADICRDNGSTALAGKVELAARVIILLLTLPMIQAVTEFAVRLIKG